MRMLNEGTIKEQSIVNVAENQKKRDMVKVQEERAKKKMENYKNMMESASKG